MQRRIVDIKVLPGEPTNGTGRVCIHLFVQDAQGPFVEPHVLHSILDPATNEPVKGKCEAKPTRGRLACDRKKSAVPVTVGAVTKITMRTDDPRAVTCPKCKESAEYASKMKLLTEG